MRQRKVLCPRIIPEDFPLGKEMTLGAQPSGGYPEGAEVPRVKIRRMRAGKPSNEGLFSPMPFSVFPFSGDRAGTIQLLVGTACLLRLLLHGLSSGLLFVNDRGRALKSGILCVLLGLSQQVWPV